MAALTTANVGPRREHQRQLALLASRRAAFAILEGLSVRRIPRAPNMETLSVAARLDDADRVPVPFVER